MNEPASAIRRILVALDNSNDSLAALEAAVQLAAAFQAELVGLFVEDTNLLRLAGLPFARELRFPSAAALDHSGMEHQLRLLAWQARRALKEAAEPRAVPWTFRVVRGQVTPELLAAALDADLLTLGKSSRPLTRSARTGSTARAAATNAPRSVLLAQPGPKDQRSGHRPVIVVYDRMPANQQTLIAAANLALAIHVPLAVLVVAEESENRQRLGEEAAARLEQLSDGAVRQLSVTYHHLPQANVRRLVEVVRLVDGGALVLGGRGVLLRASAMQTLLDELDCLVMIIRS